MTGKAPIWMLQVCAEHDRASVTWLRTPDAFTIASFEEVPTRDRWPNSNCGTADLVCDCPAVRINHSPPQITSRRPLCKPCSLLRVTERGLGVIKSLIPAEYMVILKPGYPLEQHTDIIDVDPSLFIGNVYHRDSHHGTVYAADFNNTTLFAVLEDIGVKVVDAINI